MMRLGFLFLCVMCFWFSSKLRSHTQQLEDVGASSDLPVQTYQDIRIGIMIQDRGTAIYSWFGHAGIILSGPPEKLQQVAFANKDFFGFADRYGGNPLMFDYGNFSFAEENFVMHFLKNRLTFSKQIKDFSDYTLVNELYEKRGMNVYWLRLNELQKKALIRVLFRETSLENRLYRYDYYFNNCLTRIRDQLDEVFLGDLKQQYKGNSTASIRELLHIELYQQLWGTILLDYLQGSSIDQLHSRWDSLIFPKMMPSFLASLKNPALGKDLLGSIETVYSSKERQISKVEKEKIIRNRYIYLFAYFILSISSILMLHIFARTIIAAIGAKTYHLLVLAWRVAVLFFALALGSASTVIYLVNYFQSHAVALQSASLLLGTPLLLLQIPLAFLWALLRLYSRFIHSKNAYRNWETRQGLIKTLSRLWLLNWDFHFCLALLLPIFAIGYNYALGRQTQDFLLPWFFILPILMSMSSAPRKIVEKCKFRKRKRND